MKKQHVQLTPEHRKSLTKMTSEGNINGRTYKRAMALLELDKGKTYVAVSEILGFTAQTLATLATKYQEHGLDCLHDKKRSGRNPVISGGEITKITALACSKPPEGYSQWSLRLLAERVVQLEYVDQISHTEVGRILKKTNSNLT